LDTASPTTNRPNGVGHGTQAPVCNGHRGFPLRFGWGNAGISSAWNRTRTLPVPQLALPQGWHLDPRRPRGWRSPRRPAPARLPARDAVSTPRSAPGNPSRAPA